MSDRAIKRRILWRRNNTCYVCKREILDIREASLEHIVPKSYGGTSKLRNLALSHYECNHSRGNIICRIVWELKLKEMRTKPRPYYVPSIVKLITSRALPHKSNDPKKIEKAWLEKMSKRFQDFDVPTYKWNEEEKSQEQISLNYQQCIESLKMIETKRR